MRKTIMALVGALATAAILAPAALAGEEGQRQTGKLKFTTKQPGAPSGLILEVDYVNPDDPDAKPPAVRRVVEVLARGARFDTAAPGRCTASDPELMLLGGAACPGESRVGDGRITLDTGFPQPGRFIASPVDFFNNTDEFIFLNRALATETPRVVTRARVTRRRTISEAPLLPGTPPDGAAVDTVFVKLFAVTSEVGGEARSYITTPPRCPPRRFWVNRVRFAYDDGVTQRIRSRSRCRPGKPGRARPRGTDPENSAVK
jgi:hypothetical protein